MIGSVAPPDRLGNQRRYDAWQRRPCKLSNIPFTHNLMCYAICSNDTRTADNGLECFQVLHRFDNICTHIVAKYVKRWHEKGIRNLQIRLLDACQKGCPAGYSFYWTSTAFTVERQPRPKVSIANLHACKAI